jgi:hypothetical protein
VSSLAADWLAGELLARSVDTTAELVTLHEEPCEPVLGDPPSCPLVHADVQSWYRAGAYELVDVLAGAAE